MKAVFVLVAVALFCNMQVANAQLDLSQLGPVGAILQNLLDTVLKAVAGLLCQVVSVVQAVANTLLPATTQLSITALLNCVGTEYTAQVVTNILAGVVTLVKLILSPLVAALTALQLPINLGNLLG